MPARVTRQPRAASAAPLPQVVRSGTTSQLSPTSHPSPSTESTCTTAAAIPPSGAADLDGANANNNFITGMTNKVRGIAVNDSHVYWTQYVDLSTETDRAVFRLGLAGESRAPPSSQTLLRTFPNCSRRHLHLLGQ